MEHYRRAQSGYGSAIEVMEMDAKVFNTLQDHIQLSSVNASVRHGEGHKEKGYKLQYDLWLIRRGKVAFEYDGSTYELNEGDMFLMYPNTIYESQVLSDGLDLIYCRFDYSLAGSPSALLNFPFSGHYPRSAYVGTGTEKVCDDFLRSFDQQSENEFLSTYINKQYFNILIAAFFDYKMKNSDDTGDAHKSLKKLNRLMPALEHIHNNYNRQVSTSELADLTAMNEKYFISYFKQVLGLTPHQYHMQLRMQKAVSLLGQQLYTIKEIAYMLGYRDQYNFSAAFKNHYKVAPSQYLNYGEKLLE